RDVVTEVFGGTSGKRFVGKGECTHQRHGDPSPFHVHYTVAKGVADLDSGLRESLLPSEVPVRCESCQDNVPTDMFTTIQQLPNTLVLSLKRFYYDMDKQQDTKVNSTLVFPDTLDMAQYIECDDESDTTQAATQYTLQGVVVHSGVAGSGHYYAYTRVPGSDGMFYELNDSTVRKVSSAHMQSSSYGQTKGTSAYILMYGRDTQSQTAETPPVHICDSDLTREKALASQVSQVLNYRLIQWLGERVMEIVQDVHRVRWNDDFHDTVVRLIGTIHGN
ncbi:hypothetical protein KIPB_012771, partial [Kipferlia bialata]